jgi:hypothetical protein
VEEVGEIERHPRRFDMHPANAVNSCNYLPVPGQTVMERLDVTKMGIWDLIYGLIIGHGDYIFRICEAWPGFIGRDPATFPACFEIMRMCQPHEFPFKQIHSGDSRLGEALQKLGVRHRQEAFRSNNLVFLRFSGESDRLPVFRR